MRLRTRRTGASQDDARHVLTVWARTMLIPTVRNSVDLPDMFAPVSRSPAGGASAILFGTAPSISGWGTPSITIGEPAGPRRGRVHPAVPARYDATAMAASASPTAPTT